MPRASLKQHSEPGVPAQAATAGGYRVNRPDKSRAVHNTCVWPIPPAPPHSVCSLPWLCCLEGKAALGHRGDCNCFKVLVKGNCVTTCLISPGCKVIHNQCRLFPSAGAAGSRRPLCFIYKPKYWGETKWLEKFPMSEEVALSYSLFPDSSMSILTQAVFSAWKFFPIRKCGFKWKQYLWGGKRDLAIVTDVFQYSREMKWSKKKTCLHLSFGAK